jgi:hypothetical protein
LHLFNQPPSINRLQSIALKVLSPIPLPETVSRETETDNFAIGSLLLQVVPMQCLLVPQCTKSGGIKAPPLAAQHLHQALYLNSGSAACSNFDC